MQPFEVTRQDGRYRLDDALERFRAYGIIVLKDFLPSGTQTELRGALEDKLATARAAGAVAKPPLYPLADFLLGDVLAIRELEEYDFIFLRPELLGVLRGLLQSEELLYFGDSSVQYGEAARGFHKDNVDRYNGDRDDWKGEYRLIRCGFYCQDHVNHSGGLKVRLASHNIPTHRRGRIVDVRTRYGDLALWNMRLTHSGNNRRLKMLPRVSLHPRLEMICPSALIRAEQQRRIGAFWSFGAAGSHLDRYIENMNVREADYKPYFQRARKPAEAVRLLARSGVSFRRPNNYYGELD